MKLTEKDEREILGDYGPKGIVDDYVGFFWREFNAEFEDLEYVKEYLFEYACQLLESQGINPVGSGEYIEYGLTLEKLFLGKIEDIPKRVNRKKRFEVEF